MVILRKDGYERARAAKLISIGKSVKNETFSRSFDFNPKQAKTDIAM